MIAGSQQRPKSINTDKARCTAFQELCKVDKAHTKTKQGIAIWTNPAMVRSTQVIPEGELVLIPTVPLAHIVAKNNKEGTLQKILEDPPLFIVPLSMPKVPEGQDKLSDDQMVVAYWLIKDTDKEEEANMKEHIVEKSGHVFKTFTNFKTIEAHTHLQVFKAAAVKKVHAQLSGAIILNDEQDNNRRKQKQLVLAD